MIVYRIAKLKHRSSDLSGTGAYNEGGRWNNTGTYALYTSENRSLAALEILVHEGEAELPPHLYIMSIEINDSAPMYEVQDTEMPEDWRTPENIALKELGDKILKGNKHIAIKAISAVMPDEYNYVLNPSFPNYFNLVTITKVEEYNTDMRLF